MRAKFKATFFCITFTTILLLFSSQKWTEFKRNVGERPPVQSENLGNFERNSKSMLYDIKWIPRLDRSLPMYKDNCTLSLDKYNSEGRPNPKIPKIVHFIYGLKTPKSEVKEPYENSENQMLDKLDQEFSLAHSLVILAAKKSISPIVIYFHYLYEPKGKYWDRIKNGIVLKKVYRLPTSIYGTPVKHFAHQADILRLEILKEFGGIYLDIDLIVFKPLDRLLHHPVVMGKENEDGLCNAFIAAEPNSTFITRWLDNYASFDDNNWNFHSVHLPFRLAKFHSNEICTLPKTHLFWPSFYQNHVDFIHLYDEYIFDNDFQLGYHFNEHFSSKYLMALTERKIRSTNTSFTRLIRPFLPDSWI